MPTVIPAGYAECSFVHQHNDTLQPAVVTLGVDTDDPSELHDVGVQWGAHMLAEMNSIYTYVRFLARVTAGTSVSDSKNIAALAGGSPMTPQVSYLLRKNTVHAGRHGHGRMYYPGCDETSVDGSGKVTSGKQTGLNTMWSTFATALAAIGGGVQAVLLHSDATTPYVVTTVVAEGVVATQRRRLRR